MPIAEHITEVAGIPTSDRYSHAVVATGRLAFVAGQIAVDEAGNVVGAGDFAAQVGQALRNMGRVLDALGAGWRDVVRFTWYLVDAAQAPVIQEVRREVIGAQPRRPASTLVQVAALVRPELLVEVDAVVALPD